MEGMSKMVRANRLKRVLLENKRPAVGVWQTLPGANLSRALAQSGADWIMVDAEHGNIDDAAMHECVPAIAAMGVSPIVRIPGLESWMVKRALDTGAHGILAPLVRTVAEVRSLVEAAKFAPQGKRGAGSPFPMQCFSSVPDAGGVGQVPNALEYFLQANEGTLLMVQIETREALDAVDEIAALVDLVFVGPLDLGINIGHPITGPSMPPELKAAIAKILQAARQAGTKAGIYCSSGDEAKMWAEMGFDMVSCSLDAMVIPMAMAANVNSAKGLKAAGK